MTQKQKITNIVKGLQILNKYNVLMYAYKDELWCKHNSITVFEVKDIEKLKKLGWRHNNLPIAWWIEV